jgi:hypothetical protein
MKFTKSLAVAGVALFTASMALVASPAQAAPERRAGLEGRARLAAARTVDLARVNLSTNNIVLNGDANCANRSRMTAVVNAPIGDPERVRSVSARLIGPNGRTASQPRLDRLRVGQNLQYTGFLRLCGNDAPGRYRLVTTLTKVTANNNVRRQTIERPLWLKRPTTLSYDATPEPVAVNGTLTHAGRLMFDPVGHGGFFGPSNQRMTLQFQPTGSTQWQLKRIFFTGSNGFYSVQSTATEDGTWRVNYPSNDYRETQNKTDFVDVTP